MRYEGFQIIKVKTFLILLSKLFWIKGDDGMCVCFNWGRVFFGLKGMLKVWKKQYVMPKSDNNYTLYTIVYKWFCIIYTRKILVLLVLISFNLFLFKLVQTDSDCFFCVFFCGFSLVFLYFHIRQLVVVIFLSKNSNKNQTDPDLKTIDASYGSNVVFKSFWNSSHVPRLKVVFPIVSSSNCSFHKAASLSFMKERAEEIFFTSVSYIL